jgi:hypothetical protein
MTAPSGPLREELSSIVRSSVLELFDALQVPLSHDGEFDASQAVWCDPVAMLGFAGERIAGTLVLSAPWPLMAITNPVGDRGPEGLADWSRELSNMVLGGIKLALLARGVTVQIGLPTSLVSTDLRIQTASRRAIGHRFLHAPWPLLVAFDSAAIPSLELHDPAPAAADAASAFFF